MFADSLAGTFYTSYLLSIIQFGHLKCSEPISSVAQSKELIYTEHL